MRDDYATRCVTSRELRMKVINESRPSESVIESVAAFLSVIECVCAIESVERAASSIISTRYVTRKMFVQVRSFNSLSLPHADYFAGNRALSHMRLLALCVRCNQCDIHCGWPMTKIARHQITQLLRYLQPAREISICFVFFSPSSPHECILSRVT